MCGIFGFTFRSEDPFADLKKMGRTQIHRGPDGDGYFVNEKLAMGMRRLSVIDPEHGNQPFFNEDESVVVICDGRIYNFQTLRKELLAKGHRITTKSDIEVLPHLYEEHGIDFVNKLDGMFAIAIYDKNTDKLSLLRDRIGAKPLYYSITSKGLIFSSELKSILSFDYITKEIDYDAFSSYLDLMFIPRPMSPFKGIYKLDSGSVLQWNDNKYNITKYWDPDLPEWSLKSEEEYIDEIEKILRSSLELGLMSDVPVGSFLSGGIDSSVVTAFAARYGKTDFETYHLRWNEVEGKKDESKLAKMVSDRYGIKQHIRNARDLDVIKLIPQLIWYMEEPCGDAAFVPTYVLSKVAAENVKVVLCGAGGDELFAGYSHHKTHSILKSIIQKGVYKRGKAFSYYDMRKTSFQRKWKGLFPWYRPDYFKGVFEAKYMANKHKDKINAIMLNDLYYYLQDDILFLTDKMTMAASIECRSPLLDHRLVELSLSIPSSLKVANGEKKIIFKKLCESYLPHEVLYREKEGFGAPVWQWISNNKDLYFDVLLENGFLMSNDLISRKGLRSLLVRSNLERNLSWFFWQILVLEIWCKLYIENIAHENIFDLT